MKIEDARKLFDYNFIGTEELTPFIKALGGGDNDIQEKPIQYSDNDLRKAASEGYILIYGIDQIDGHKITLRFLRDHFGISPEVSEPCFYNQDWYLKEDFIDVALNDQWYLIKKEVLEDSRAVMPLDLVSRGLNFPMAILCGYTFFAYFFARNEFLWWHDFVWCCDSDHNGDRIYVGKYHDIDGVNKNGFSIHRHLALRNCYASTNCI